MQRHEFFNEWEAVQRELGYSQAVLVGDVLHIAGTASVDTAFAPLHAGDFDAQLRAVYARLAETLDRAGLGFADVVREVIYVTSMRDFVAATPIRRSFYGEGPFPAATAVEVRQLLFPELMVEIEMLAVRHR
jgi:2-iminobutanoate/2-iminopropanoate deaminase